MPSLFGSDTETTFSSKMGNGIAEFFGGMVSRSAITNQKLKSIKEKIKRPIGNQSSLASKSRDSLVLYRISEKLKVIIEQPMRYDNEISGIGYSLLIE